MKLLKTELEGVFIIESLVHKDQRGDFFESYNKAVFKEHGIDLEFVQDNQSRSKKGVLRGLHYQKNPHAQTKLIRVVEGSIMDIVVDIRRSSPSYGRYISLELSQEGGRQLLVPKGFAHGFIVLSDMATVVYKSDAFYNKDHEAGIRFDDPELNIDWGIPHKDILLSEKDRKLPFLGQADNNF